MADKQRISGLKWVKGEIGATLRPVRELVEAGADFRGRTKPAEVLKSLNQVQGVLLALRLTAPARLVEEMSRLAEHLDQIGPGEEAEALAVMGQALDQLVNHLDRLDAGFEEPPLSLWSIINALRSVCGQLPLTHSELLNLALSDQDDDAEGIAQGLSILSEVMRQVRPQFHRCLVQWYRGDSQGLVQLGGLFRQLSDYLRHGTLADLFALSEHLCTVLQDGRLESSPGVRTLIGHLDWVLKPLIQRPPVWPEAEAKTLIEQLIELLTAAGIEDPALGEIRLRYAPPPPLSGADVTQTTPKTNAALAQLAGELVAELDTLKADLNRLVPLEPVAQDVIQGFGDRLRHLAARLEDAVVGNLPERLRTLGDRLQTLDATDLEDQTARLESYAMELLGIESALLALANRRDADAERLIAPDMDLADLTAATLREASYDLSRVKEAVADWQRTPGSYEILSPIQGSLLGVSGALRILSEHLAADLAERIANLVQTAYVQRRRPSTAAQIDHLAEALAGLELYIDHLQQPMPGGETLIDRAERAISALQAELGPLDDVPEEPDAPPATAPEPEPLATPIASEHPDQGTGPEPEDNETGLEIFLEEAREELETARTQLARWRADPSDTESLTSLRRSFHTLKGSGRLVGALQVGDFAQAMEFLLNRLIETQGPPSTEILDCITEAVRVLPMLLEAQSEGHPFDIEPLVLRATQLRDGLGTEHPSGGSQPTTAADVCSALATPDLAEEPMDHDSLFAEDSKLLDIFRTEAREHLSVLHAFLDSGQADEAHRADESIARALHTLTGSARMSGIESIARVTKAMESRIKPLLAGDVPLSAPLAALFRRAVAAIEQRLDELPASGQGVAALQALLPELTQPQMPEVAPTPSEPAIEPVAPDSDSIHAELEPLEYAPLEFEPEGVALTDDVAHEIQVAVDDTRLESFVEPGVECESPATDGAVEGLKPPIEPGLETRAESAPPPIEPQVEPVETPRVAESPRSEVTPAPETTPEGSPPTPDPELAALFLEEARDLLDKLDRHFQDWLLAPQDREVLAGVNRLLHTIKGSARLAGLSAIGDLSHAIETRLKSCDEDQGGVNDVTLELAQRAIDSLSAQVDALEQGAPIPRMAELVAELSGTAQRAGSPTETTAPGADATRPPPGVPDSVPSPLAHPSGAPAAEAQGREGSGAIAAIPQIRVRSDLLNRLVNQAGEISIYRARLAQRNGQLGFGLNELDQTVIRLREQLRQLEIETQSQILYRFERGGEGGEHPETTSDYDAEFDPLEFDRFSRLQQLSGSLAETVNDLISIKEMLAGYQREMTDLLTQQGRLADDLQDGLLRTRLVPFVQVVPRLHRLVRQTAETLGKSARLEVIGPEVELDRTILDRLVAPLEHLLRNAVDHGLEDTETRVARGKPATGLVTLTLRREGNDAVISLADDGKGLDLEAIRRQAIARGLITPDSRLPDEAILQFIMEPGFTTSGKVTQISGRGVGLDVVASEVKAANGTMTLESIPGKGTRFTLRLPLTLAIIDAFLVLVGETVYAVPHSTVEGVARISREELSAIYADPSQTYAVRGQHYHVVYLGQALEPNGPEPDLGERRWLPILLARIGDQRVALQADSLLESQRILVKPLGPQLASVRWLSGGTILPDGRVALILDALALVRSGAIRKQAQRLSPPEPSGESICVMVVDDSLTVRRVTKRLLLRQNMEVMTAKDGVEALTLLDERIPDVVLLDVEMPRMDGYELTRHIRRSERFKDLPIIMITSRTGAKHRDYATQLGVNRYLGKPYQEAQLIAEINALVGKRHRTEAPSGT
ncbi:MAG: Hpt domain-containing protein [Thermochromatium sp.]